MAAWTAAEAVAAGELFGISGNATRVALARLAAAGLVDAKTRGSYRLGQAGEALDNEVSAWRSAEARVVPWSGRWIAVLTTGLPRTDRAAWRARERALSLLGLRGAAGRAVRAPGQSRWRRRLGARPPGLARGRRRNAGVLRRSTRRAPSISRPSPALERRRADALLSRRLRAADAVAAPAPPACRKASPPRKRP
ncbi:MAG: hypothetical protein MZV49_22835 [Rhodopseudomonas palustris]|nr:hypothetical protein [Rhodopseudomonas palustris]